MSTPTVHYFDQAVGPAKDHVEVGCGRLIVVKEVNRRTSSDPDLVTCKKCRETRGFPGWVAPERVEVRNTRHLAEIRAALEGDTSETANRIRFILEGT